MTWDGEIDIEEVRSKLVDSRIIRLAMDSLEENLPAGMMTGHLALELIELRKKLAEMDREELCKIGHRDYMILAPVSYLERAGGKAASAMRTLDELGLVIRLDDLALKGVAISGSYRRAPTRTWSTALRIIGVAREMERLTTWPGPYRL